MRILRQGLSSQNSLFRKERGVWAGEGRKLVKNDKQVIPRYRRSKWVQPSAEREPGCIHSYQSITYK